MRSNFDTPMELKEGVVEACGPLDWTGETEAFVTVTVRQPGGQAVGTASRSTIEPGEDEWMVEVKAAPAPQMPSSPTPLIPMGLALSSTCGRDGGAVGRRRTRRRQRLPLDPGS